MRFTESEFDKKALITFHGTVLYYDSVDGSIKHGVVSDVEVNLYLISSGSEAFLVWQDGDNARPLGDFGVDICTATPDFQERRLTLAPQQPALFAIRLDGRHLCAEPGGKVGMSRSKAHAWETFLLVDHSDLSRLEFVLVNRWLSRSTREFATPETSRCVEGHMVEFGRLRVPLVDLIEASRPIAGGDAVPKELALTFDDWKVEHYILYKPLAYFVAYGDREFFQCAEIAIGSLFKFGRWDGDVFLITDSENGDFSNKFTKEIGDRISIFAVSSRDTLDFALARYKLPTIQEANIYQPIIYIDSDIVCDASVAELMKDIALSDAFQVWQESNLGNEGNFFGRFLLIEDKALFDPDSPGVNCGILAFSNIEKYKRLFDEVIGCAYSYAMKWDNRATIAYDQPFFNYILYRSGIKVEYILQDRLIIHNQYNTHLHQTVGKGFVHFAGFVGHSSPKLAHMINYVEILERDSSGELDLVASPGG